MLLSSYLQSIGFKRLDANWGMYFRAADRCYLLLYVDDVLIAASEMSVIDSVREMLTAKWQWSDIGSATFILGFKIERNPESREIRLSQS